MSNKNKAKTDAPDAPDAPEAKPARLCACGCGIATGKRTMWRQGHDARAKGWLQRMASGRMIEGERELATALLGRKSAALETDAFIPLVDAAKAAIAASKAA